MGFPANMGILDGNRDITAFIAHLREVAMQRRSYVKRILLKMKRRIKMYKDKLKTFMNIIHS